MGAPAAGQGGGVEQRVSLVTLGVADVARARAIYERLGWRGESPDGEVVFFQAGGVVVALWGRHLVAADVGADDGGGFGGIALAHNVRSPAEVDALLAEAAAAGAEVTRWGAPTPWGGYSGAFRDPDGHPWEVAHNPGWVLTEAGEARLR